MPSSKLRTCSNDLVLRDAILVRILNDVIEPEFHRGHGCIQFSQIFPVQTDCTLFQSEDKFHRLRYMKFWLYDIFQNPYKYCVSQNQAV